jgi:hypothetical protein
MWPYDFDRRLAYRARNNYWGHRYPIGAYGPKFSQTGLSNWIGENGIYLIVLPWRSWSNVIPLVNLHELNVKWDRTWETICDKKQLSAEIYNEARAYWRKWSTRKYQKAIAQWLQRELELPGEVAATISKFA